MKKNNSNRNTNKNKHRKNNGLSTENATNVEFATENDAQDLKNRNNRNC
ncbi:hypothetical protein ACFFHM_11260 [Halalkalibacter kiskunsagensis]|uniref:Uncharacterized protein n=1 Tax=Halalkalibacter kiskunsagensis TaxID=1548599 RepID=A0ABV6KCJ4_9BACI